MPSSCIWHPCKNRHYWGIRAFCDTRRAMVECSIFVSGLRIYDDPGGGTIRKSGLEVDCSSD